MADLALWSGDDLADNATWTGSLGTGDSTTPAVTKSGTSAVALVSSFYPAADRTPTIKLSHAVSQNCYVSWVNGSVVSQNSGRVYFYTANQIANQSSYPLCGYSGTTQIWRLRWIGNATAGSRYIALMKGDGTNLATSTTALTAATWYRIEWRMNSSNAIEFQFFAIGTSEYTPVSGLSVSGTVDAGIDRVVIGTRYGTGVVSPQQHWDDLQWTDTYAWLGSYGRVDAAPTVTAPALGVVASPGTSAEGFVSGSNGVTTAAPAMALVTPTAATKVTGYVTTTAPTVAVTAADPYLGAQTLANNVSYHDGIGASTSRTFNLFAPVGTAPPSGWPLVLYVHGGGWNGGGRGSIIARNLNHLLSLGYAVASIDYELTVFNSILNTNTGATHPEPVSDTLCALKYIVANYDINPDRVVMFGTSAGGHIALEAALTRNDTHAYTWGFTRSGLRQDAEPQTNPTFNYDQGSRTGLPDLLGVFIVAGVVNAEYIYSHPVDIWPLAVKTYGGCLPGATYPLTGGTGAQEELNLDALIEGRTGTIYTGYSHVPDFPIAYVEATNDTVVPAAAGITPLTAALDTMGYDTSTGVNVVNTVGGLTHFRESGATADEHDEVEVYFDLQKLTDWLDALSSDNGATVVAPSVAVTVPTAAATVAGRITTAAPALAATVNPATWVQIDGRKTTTAPAVAVSAVVPVPHVGVNKTVTAPAVTVTVGASTGEGGVVGVATAQAAHFAVPAPGVKIGKNITTTAPRLAVTAGASTGKAGKLAYTTAPTVGLHAVATAKPSITTTTAAPSLALGPGTVTGSSGRQITAQAAAMTLAAAVGFTVRRGATVVTVGPRVTVTVPSPQAASSTASALLFRAPRSSRRPDFTRATRRESTE